MSVHLHILFVYYNIYMSTGGILSIELNILSVFRNIQKHEEVYRRGGDMFAWGVVYR